IVYYHLLPALLLAGKLDEAERELDTLDRLTTMPVDAIALRGDLELRRENWAKAAELFQRCLDKQRADKHRPDYWCGLAIATAAAGDARGARAALDSAGKTPWGVTLPWLSVETVEPKIPAK